MSKAIKLTKSEERFLSRFPLKEISLIYDDSRTSIPSSLEKKGLVRRGWISRTIWFLTKSGKRFLESREQEKESGTHPTSI